MSGVCRGVDVLPPGTLHYILVEQNQVCLSITKINIKKDHKARSARPFFDLRG